MSQATAELIQDRLLAGIVLRDLGEHRLKDLSRPEHVYQIVSSDLLSEFPALRTLDQRPNYLPIQPTSFIGREHELAQIKSLVATTALLTLIGTGGCGKTRVALQSASNFLDDFPDGVWFVDLAPPDTLTTLSIEQVRNNEAIALFVDRARAVVLDFGLT